MKGNAQLRLEITDEHPSCTVLIWRLRRKNNNKPED
jgi:hypothetical protein